MRTRTHGEVETWRCDACGAYTDEPLQVCNECQAKRLDGPTPSSGKKARRSRKQGVKTVKAKQPRKKSTKGVQPPRSEEPVQDTTQDRSKLIEVESALPTVVQSGSSMPTEIDDSVPLPQDSTFNDNPNDLVFGPTDQEEANQDQAQPESLGESAVVPPSEFSSESSYQDRFSLVYVNTPVLELIKRKIDIDFETFPTISVGRSPENVVVIPDAGVSRTHAELRKEGNRVILTDLQSSNGTYLYDGREFQRVQDSVELTSDSLVKLGTGTILRFIAK